MVYMAAQPTHGTEVFVGDEEELAEVRWASLAEAEELMNGMIFEPGQKNLQQALGNGSGRKPCSFGYGGRGGGVGHVVRQLRAGGGRFWQRASARAGVRHWSFIHQPGSFRP